MPSVVLDWDVVPLPIPEADRVCHEIASLDGRRASADVAVVPVVAGGGVSAWSGRRPAGLEGGSADAAHAAAVATVVEDAVADRRSAWAEGGKGAGKTIKNKVGGARKLGPAVTG